MRPSTRWFAGIGIAASSLAAAGDGGWSIVATPNQGSLGNVLNGVAASSSGQAVAVGHRYDEALAAYRTLAMRFSGSAWQIQQTPNVGNGYNELYGVSARMDDDVWAVGYSRQDPYAQSKPLIVHSNGSTWSVVPTGQNVIGDLQGIAATAADDAWAVGRYTSGGGGRLLALHWNGVQWTKVDPPNASSYTAFTAVSALTADDVWAVGYTSVNGRYVTLTEHWDGTAWSVVPSPTPGSQDGYLRAVVAIAPDDVWAVGTVQGMGSLALRWNGTTWRVVGRPRIGATLWGVAARDADDVWAAGYVSVSGGIQTLVQHWNGHGWTEEASPDPGLNPALFGVAAGGGNAWAVGLSNNGTSDRTLSLRALLQ